MSEQTKRCTRCNQLLPISKFNKAKLGKYGVRSWCKHCNDEYTKQWRKDNPQSAFKSRHQYKINALTHYGGNPPICMCCGEEHIEFLTIDHILGGGTEHRREINRKTIYHWLYTNNYPEGYRVLCMNCNLAYGVYGYCPHQTKSKFSYLEGKDE